MSRRIKAVVFAGVFFALSAFGNRPASAMTCTPAHRDFISRMLCAAIPMPDTTTLLRPRSHRPDGNPVLIVGVDFLLTQLARCCHPVPPDPVVGFVTRGKGVTVREDVQDQGFGLVTSIDVPGAGWMMLYQPRHGLAYELEG